MPDDLPHSRTTAGGGTSASDNDNSGQNDRARLGDRDFRNLRRPDRGGRVFLESPKHVGVRGIYDRGGVVAPSAAEIVSLSIVLACRRNGEPKVVTPPTVVATAA